jgi:hypothetical protein
MKLKIFIAIFILIIICIGFTKKETFLPTKEYLSHKSSCFSCEKQFINMYGENSAWRGQPSKLYSAEKQGVDMYGESGGFIGKTMKYY